MKELKIKESLAIGWEGTKNNWAVLLGLVGLYFLASIVQNVIVEFMPGTALKMLSVVSSMALNLLFGLILTQFGLQIAVQRGGKAASFGELELGGELVGRYFLMNLVVYAAVLAAVLALVFLAGLFAAVGIGSAIFSDPGALKTVLKEALPVMVIGVFVLSFLVAYLCLAYAFVPLVLLHQGLGPLESFTESKRLTEGVKGDMVLFWLAVMGLAFVGLLCLVVGIIPAMMVISIAWPVLYLQALEQSGPRPAHA